MPIKPPKLEMGEITEEDEEKMWDTFRQVWKKEHNSADITITELTDMPIEDHSLHYRMKSVAGGHVDFGVLDNEMCAYAWKCPSEERFFLKNLERYAAGQGLKLTFSTILDEGLAKFLEENGYTMAQVPYHDDILDLWSKKERIRIKVR